jgi:integrase
MAEIENDYYYEFIAILLCSGMRIGELGALSWRDIDGKNNVIHITKTLSFDEDGTMVIGDSPKSEAGKRDIPLTATLKALFTRWKNKTENIYSMNGTVFVTTEGNMIHNHSINRVISRALDRLDKQGRHIEHFTAHALRDTYATRYIEQGGNMQTLKALLGHSSLAMTMDLYSHVLPDTKHKEAESMEFDIAL